MGQKVAFATTNWKNRPNKPSDKTQAEWDAEGSSKFNGFPFPIEEIDPSDVVVYDGSYTVQISAQSSFTTYEAVSTQALSGKKVVIRSLGEGLTLEEAIKLYWRVKSADFSVTLSSDPERLVGSGSPGPCSINQAVTLDLSEETDLITRTSNWFFYYGEDLCYVDYGSYTRCGDYYAYYDFLLNRYFYKIGNYYYPDFSFYRVRGGCGWTVKQSGNQSGLFIKSVSNILELCSPPYGCEYYPLTSPLLDHLNTQFVFNASIFGKTFQYPIYEGIDYAYLASFTTPEAAAAYALNDEEGYFSTSDTDLTFEPTEYWEYANSEGQPVYDASSGAQLVDPLS